MALLGLVSRIMSVVLVGVLAPLSWWWLDITRQDTVAVGPWRTSLAAGTAQADLHTRTYIAITGLLALNRNETLYFNADHDDEGRRLAAECSYDVAGMALPARWWSLTAYAGDHFLIPNALNRYAYTMNTVRRDESGHFIVAIGPRERAGDWLPSGEAGKGLSLLIRLYNPTPEAAGNPAAIPLPRIRRIGACP